MNKFTNRHITSFRTMVWDHYKASGRHDLPWRKTTDPYKIVVSEAMLQQTQVARVLPKYKQFLKLFPTLTQLARSPLGEVLAAWQGLGYNRRAKFLHGFSQEVIVRHQGKVPSREHELLELPGIGKATAAAIRAFAFNLPSTYLETNVRSVFIHHFFPTEEGVSDSDLIPLIEMAAKDQSPRQWNWALLDYGVFIKSTHGNPNVRSKHYTKQSRFEGSNRQLRGQILRLLQKGPLGSTGLYKALNQPTGRVMAVLDSLLREELITKRGRNFYLG